LAEPATDDSASADHELQERLEAVWNERKDILDLANNLTHADHQALLYRKVREDGGVLIKRTRRSRREPVWIEVVERDRLATPIGNARPKSAQNARIDDGVEKDADGVPVAYWIMKGHPGDAHVPLRPEDWTRVEASEVQYLRRIERPGQTHGVPAFHAILQDLRDLDLLMLAALKRTQIAACMAVFLKSPLSPEDVVQATGQKYGYKLDQALEPGMIWKLNPEEEIQTLIPNFPTPELGPFIVMLARRIGAALGVSWQVVLKDFSDSTYSSARTDLLEARITYRTDQQWMADRPLRWEWWTVMEDARLLGDPRLAGVTDEQIEAVNWIPPGWQWVDPEKEAAAAEIELRLGITTLQDICAGRGKDWEEQMEQRLRERARERDLRAELGIPETDAPPAPAAVAKPADDADDEDNGAEGGNGDAARLARLYRLTGTGVRK
ncbi:MAG TPA: phage portal protein, partial [Phycisphaerae bacterium]|nr:phage portal protein [Phycisphaerae bacterium]